MVKSVEQEIQMGIIGLTVLALSCVAICLLAGFLFGYYKGSNIEYRTWIEPIMDNLSPEYKSGGVSVGVALIRIQSEGDEITHITIGADGNLEETFVPGLLGIGTP